MTHVIFFVCWRCGKHLDNGVLYYTNDIGTPACWQCALITVFRAGLPPTTKPPDNSDGEQESE